MVWYSKLLKNFPQFVVIHIIKGFGIPEVDIFLEFSCFFDDPKDAGNSISGSSAFSKFSWVAFFLENIPFHLDFLISWHSIVHNGG